MHILEISLIIGLILLGFSVLQHFSNKTLLPYTILLLLFGFIGKEILFFFGFKSHLTVSSDITYYFLLPLLLFGAAIHINFHQFKIQFKTISFLATFGLLISVATIGVLVCYFLGIDLGVSLLFGALISATDPIAVLALFKSLGSPKRLALIADGESMLNDATAVVVFRIIATVVVGGSTFNHITFLHSALEFFYVFIGSILAGAIFGYCISNILSKIKNDIAIETTVTVATALLAFTASEHYIHLSGVITAVVAGIFVGNLGRSRISSQVIHFVHEFWDYVGYLAVSVVFFFATYELDIKFLISDFHRWFPVILIVLAGRAISVYFSTFITNRLSFFSDEPNIPLSWQHIMNWGGLRGVIPLVLIFSLPDSFFYKEELFLFTFSSLLFTLFINGSTISILLKKLKLHLPSSSEKISLLHEHLFDIEAAIRRLQTSKLFGISPEIISTQLKEWKDKEKTLIQEINTLCSPDEFKSSLKLQTLNIERGVYQKLLEREEISEAVFYELDAHLDLQTDAYEYPEMRFRNINKHGQVKTLPLFRQRVLGIRQFATQHPFLSKLFHLKESDLYLERFMVLRSRIIGAERALLYLKAISQKLNNKELQKVTEPIIKEYKDFITENNTEIFSLREKISVEIYEKHVVSHALIHRHSPWII